MKQCWRLAVALIIKIQWDSLAECLMSFAQTNSGFYIFTYIQTGHSIYIYYLLYNYVHLYTHSNHSNTQTQRGKLRVWAGGLNRTQKTPLDMERIFRSNWCFYHGWHESFYFDEKRKYIQWKQTQQKTPMEFKVW